MLEAKVMLRVFLHPRPEPKHRAWCAQAVEEVFNDMVRIQEGMEASHRAVAAVSSPESQLHLLYHSILTRFVVLSKTSGPDARIKTEEEVLQPLLVKDTRVVFKD
jgi:hypothetical protein